MWKFFLGACVLTGAILQPHAPPKAIARGMGLAALVFGAWMVASGSRTRNRDMDESNERQNGRDT